MSTSKRHQRITQLPDSFPQSSARTNWLSYLVSAGLALCLVTAPSNLFLKFDQVNWAIRGLRIDYLLPKLYLSDLGLLLVLGLMLLWQYHLPMKINLSPKWSRLTTLSLVLLVVAWLIRQFFTPYPLAAIVGAIRLLSYCWLGWQVRLRWSELKHAWLWWALLISLTAQSGLALFQFATQHSLGNYRFLLGEPDLSHTYGIVHGNFRQWGELILPYGTTAHPNILAGWVVGGCLLLLSWWQEKFVKHRWWLNLFLVVMTLVAAEILWITQSWSASGLLIHGSLWLGWKTGIITIGIAQWKKRNIKPQLGILLICLIAVLFTSPWWTKAINELPWLSAMPQRSLSWERRVWLSEAAIKIWQQQPWLGVGLNQFTAYLETATHQTELVRFVQPAHQVAWLWLSENGLLGIALIISFGYWIQQRDRGFWSRCLIWLWISSPVLMWDHYLLTIPTGLWLS